MHKTAAAVHVPIVGRRRIQQYNRQLILSLFKGGRSLSRRDIVALTGMRQGTMQVHVEQLLAEGLIREKGPGRSKAGRRPRLLQINPTVRLVVGGYLQPDRIRLVLANLLGDVLARHSEVPTVPEDREHLLLALRRALTNLLEGRCGQQDLLGVSLGVPGLVDSTRKITADGHFGPYWKGIELGKYIEHELSCRCWTENDIRLATLAEARFGVCTDVNNFIYVSLGEKLEVGLMIDGTVYAGADGLAGQFGHLCVIPDGPLCVCGNRGCLNGLASDAALVDFYCKTVGYSQPEELDAASVVMLARSGDAAAAFCLEQVAKWLGLALANLANLLNPAKIVIAGQMSLAGELFLVTVSQSIREHALSGANQPRIEWSQLADQAVQLGALARALDDFFAVPATHGIF